MISIKEYVKDHKVKLIEMSDVFVSAIGVPGHFDDKYNFSNCDVIIDVGITRCDDKLRGDIDPIVEENHPMTYVTPVPGGVGLLTRLQLMNNVINAFMYQHLNKR